MASQRLPDEEGVGGLAQRLDLAGSRIDPGSRTPARGARRALDAVTRSLRPDGLHRGSVTRAMGDVGAP